ncbi:hypothetical protein L207DRAFT_320101 [Hyaloscypha variabilis F]|uniref:Uncharacterized protein n=1 Tax=Hyaloscypha variabilis (strain UAMH 11265 / GT02V1 / F) TaxID=1149755 RepID=A0A2J6RWD7_HYAVF|nr:hypothetical protein L207DRAFT_320101 [Hyaloscypha variabilis F]
MPPTPTCVDPLRVTSLPPSPQLRTTVPAGLNPEASICHSGFDTPDCHNGDPSSG